MARVPAIARMNSTVDQSPARPAASFLRRFRIAQIRFAASLLNFIGRIGSGASFLEKLRRSRVLKPILNAMLGFKRTFATFAEAESFARHYSLQGHVHADEIQFHTAIAGSLRESDYPMLFFLAPAAPHYRRIFDLGGNVGNLFYSYAPSLSFSANLQWQVLDLPEKQKFCESLAAERHETRVEFAPSFAAASGADVLIASGSIHYFDQPLDRMLRQLDVLPRQVFINRSPFSRVEDVITVQDNGSYFVACIAYGKSQLIEGMKQLGYQLKAEWPVHERRLVVPLCARLLEPAYSGLYFELVPR
jgi:putative methyltransferase (TIGR04325 family)